MRPSIFYLYVQAPNAFGRKSLRYQVASGPSADGLKVTVDLQRPNFMTFFFFAHNTAKTTIKSLVKKNKLKSFNDRKISGENYFGEELMNN